MFPGRWFMLRLTVALISTIMMVIAAPSFAQDNRRLVYSGRILKPDGSPVSGNVNFALSIISPNGCIMWSEAQTVNMTGTSGTFSIELGNPTNKTASATGVSNINDTFKNYGTFTGMAAMPSTGCLGAYTASNYDDRTLYVSFNDGGGAQTINVPIKSEPFAFQAQNANGIFGYSFNGSPTTGQFLMFDGTNWVTQTISSGGILTLGGQSGAAQTFAIGTGGSTPAWSSASNTHTLNIPMASAVGVTAGLLSKSDYDAFNTKLGTSLTNGQLWLGNGSNVATAVSLSGDATVTNAGVVTVAKVQNRTVASTAPTNGQVLTWNNGTTQWEPQTLAAAPVSSVAGKTGVVVLNIADVKSTVGGGAFLTGAGCSAGQALTYSSVTDTISCTSVTPSVGNSSTLSNGKIWIGDGSSKAQEQTLSGDATISNTGVVTLAGLDTSKITTGTLAAARMPALTGDVTTSAGSTATTIAAGAVTAAKLGSDVGAWSVTGSDVYRSSGNVGMGTSSPAGKLHIADSTQYADSLGTESAPLHVVSTYAGTGSNIAVFENTNAAGGSQLDIFTQSSNATALQARENQVSGAVKSLLLNPAGGNVGVGTTTPQNDSVGFANGNTLYIKGTGSTNPEIFLEGNYTGSTQGVISFGNGNNVPLANIINMTNGTGGDLIFNTKPDSGNSQERLRIDKNGNVGIGTTSPGAKLDIRAGAGPLLPVTAYGDSAGRNIGLFTSDFVASTTGSSLRFNSGAGTGNTYWSLQAYTAGEVSANGNIILNSGGGNVGIGTTSPGGKLSIQSAGNGSTPDFRFYNASGTAKGGARS